MQHSITEELAQQPLAHHIIYEIRYLNMRSRVTPYLG